MMNIEITKMSSKGQVVIPKEMRKDIKEGETLVVIQNRKQIIIERMEDLDENFEEDFKFAKRTEEAWKRYEKGEFIEMDYDEFLKQVRKW